MTVFQVLPTPPDAPLSVPSLERGAAMTFTEASVGSPPAITLRIARLPADFGFPTDNPPQDPDFLLSVGGSAAVIPQQPSKLSITDQNGATVATANYLPDTFDIFRHRHHPAATGKSHVDSANSQQRQAISQLRCGGRGQ